MVCLMVKVLKTLTSEAPAPECTACYRDAKQCACCGYFFEFGDVLFCVENGAEHFCEECVDA